jgi:hypothetical protein
MMHLIDNEQGAIATGLGKVQFRRSRNGLVGGDVTCQASARIWFVVGGTQGEAVRQRSTPNGVGERFFSLKA